MKKLSLLCILMLITACSTTTTHMSTIVPADAPLSIDTLNDRIVAPGITGKDTKYVILFFPLGQPSFSAAVDDTLTNGYGHLLTNAEITERSRWFGLFGYNQIEIKADVVNLK